MALKLSGLFLVGALLAAAAFALTLAPAAPRARAATGGWTAEYYNNMTLAGAPVLGRYLDLYRDGTRPARGVALLDATATAVPTATDVPTAAPTDAPPVTSTSSPTHTVVAMDTVVALSPPPTAVLAATDTPLLPSATSTPGRPLTIECLWALPDMRPDAPGIQYVPASADDAHDHDMAVMPDADNDAANGTQPPCAGPPATLPSQPDGVRHLMQVVPNLDDLPEQRRIQLWLAADAPAGGGEIAAFWYVYYPDGSTVGGVASTPVPPADCAAYGGPPGSMFEAAVHTGQVAPASVSDPALGLIAQCQAASKQFFHGEFPLSKDQPCGEYGITAVAVTASGSPVMLAATFDVICTFSLKIDFNAVDWGTLAPGQPKVVGGDTLFAPPGDTLPSIRNAGNDGMGLKLEFSTTAGVSSGQIIDEFHACFGRNAVTLQCINPIAAGALTSFDADPARTLCASEIGRLDLAVHPPGIVPADVYHGAVTLIGYHIAGRCAGNQHLP